MNGLHVSRADGQKDADTFEDVWTASTQGAHGDAISSNLCSGNRPFALARRVALLHTWCRESGYEAHDTSAGLIVQVGGYGESNRWPFRRRHVLPYKSATFPKGNIADHSRIKHGIGEVS